MLGDDRRLDAPRELVQLLQMPRVERIDRAERKADAMQRDRIFAANALERGERRAAEVVLAVDLEEAQRRAAPRSGALTSSVRLVFGGLAGVGAARGRALAAHLLARALRHVLPFVGRVVLRGLAGARVARRAAVVLTGLGDAVALLHRGGLVLRGVGVLRAGDGEDGGDGGLGELAGGRHRMLLRYGPAARGIAGILPP